MKRFSCVAVLCALLLCSARVIGQATVSTEEFSRKNTFSIFAEYSNTSSHIVLGNSRQRKLADLGGSYARRIVRFGASDLDYLAELRPVLFESDPLTIDHVKILYDPVTGPPTYQYLSTSVNYVACRPHTTTFTESPTSTSLSFTAIDSYTCGRQWTFGQSFAPLGLKYSMRTRHPSQPFAILTAGYMYTSRPVPMAEAEAFNFVFNVGVGVELFKSEKRGRSVSTEVRMQHFSNKDTAPANPGVDNVIFKVSYSFGK